MGKNNTVEIELNKYVKNMVKKIPELNIIYQKHLNDNFNKVLAHVFFGDLTRYVILLNDSICEEKNEEKKSVLKSIMNYLENGLKHGDEYIQDLIIASFLENLDFKNKNYHSLKSFFGPELMKKLDELEKIWFPSENPKKGL